MAGYVRKPLRLVFEDSEFDGLDVRAKRVSLGKIFSLMEVSEGLGDDDTKLAREQVEALIEAVFPCLLFWNLQELVDPADEDGPRRDVPLTREAFEAQDPGLVLAIASGIIDTAGGTPGPLEPGSIAGENSATLAGLVDLSNLPEPSSP